jgi:predicted HicB family RNase H-like nuclease
MTRRRGRPWPEGERKTDLVKLRARPSDRATWEEAAEEEGQSLSAWIESAANLVGTPEIEAIRLDEDPDYAITDDGQVFSEKRERGRWQRLKLSEDDGGYLKVQIGGRPRGVHVLVLLTFRGPPQEGQVCRHLDGNPANNHLDNLAWGTRSENAHDSVKHQKMRKAGLLPPIPKRRTTILGLRVDKKSFEMYQAAADAAGMTRNAWANTVLRAAAGLKPLPKELKRAVVITDWEDEPQKVRDGDW